MVPEEWPIAAEPADHAVDSVRARGQSRLATVRRDFFLDPAERLTEQERALMTAMLHDLVAALAGAIRAEMGGKGKARPPEPDPAKIAATLGAAGLLDRPRLIRLMLRRADEQRILSAFAGHAGPRRLALLPRLVSDDNPAIAAAAMALVVARGRRRDGFGQPRLDLSDLDRRDARALAHAVAATLAQGPEQNARLADAATRVFDAIDSTESLDRWVEALVAALDQAGRADDALVEAASSDGEVVLLSHLVARRAGIGEPAVWDHLVSAGEGGVALVARMAGFSRRAAARLIVDLGSTTGSWSVEDEIGRFDALDPDEAAAALSHWQLPTDYRAALNAMGANRG
jgi:hypothetical protein